MHQYEKHVSLIFENLVSGNSTSGKHSILRVHCCTHKEILSKIGKKTNLHITLLFPRGIKMNILRTGWELASYSIN